MDRFVYTQNRVTPSYRALDLAMMAGYDGLEWSLYMDVYLSPSAQSVP